MSDIFKAVIENFVLPIWIKDLDLKFIYASDKYLELLGKSNDEVIGKMNKDIFDEKVANRFQRKCEEALKEKRTVYVESVMNNTYTQCAVSPVLDEKGNAIGVSGVIGIIDGQGKIREKEYELRAQSDLIRGIIDIIPGVIFYKDAEGKYIYANSECKEFYEERGVYEIIGKTDAEINPDKEQVKKFVEDDKWILNNKKPIENEAVFADNNGNARYRKVTKMPLLDYYGNSLGIVGRSVDITRERNYRKKLEFLSYTDILTGAKNRTAFEEYDREISKKENFPIGVLMGDANGLKLINDTFGHRCGDKFLKEIVKILKEVSGENVFRIGGDEFVILIKNTTPEYCESLIEKLQKEYIDYDKEFFKLSISLGYSMKKDKDTDIYDALAVAEDIVYKEKLKHNETAKSIVIESIKKNSCLNNPETERHATRVANNAVKIGKRLNLSENQLEELKIAGEFHDLGKVILPEEILLKESKLTKAEYEIMKTHAEKGYRIIKAISNKYRGPAEIILGHHERWDGKGYPKGLKGESTPITSRILCLSDAYDIMRSKRVYKKAMKRADALEEVKRCSGTQFDPKVVEAFFEVLDTIEENKDSKEF
ncbi:MAG: sensor domain-containing diguanylate cyclase/phosphohydrolase [Clostridium sp.]